ncbi:CALR protein, partial [Polypterus senegalus]
MLLSGLLLVLFAAVVIADPTVHFREDFLDGDAWESRWVESTHKSDYGKFKLTAGKFYGDAEKDKGVQTSQDARFYAISSSFEPFSNEGKTLVIQFTVKHEQKIDCGGGYVKIFPADLNQKEMHGDSQYYIMFGPDICGYSTKKDDELTHLYTLILRPDQTYEVKIDNEKVESGSLEEDWDFLPPKKIKDPSAKKPEDWDDKAKIDDPADTKPEDWDKPENVPDPEAKKPEDWDEDMDGEWEPPMIPNPEYKVKSGTIFDNFLITDDEKFAEEVGKETWGVTKGPEKKMREKQEEEERKQREEEEKKKKDEEKEEEEDDDDDDTGDDDDEVEETTETDIPEKDEL